MAATRADMTKRCSTAAQHPVVLDQVRDLSCTLLSVALLWGPRGTTMADIVDRETRSRMMAGIRSRDTRPELLLRRAIHAHGLRYRLHDRRLPGTPDLVFRRFRAVCFVHGCFWHRHAGCPYATTPSTREEFWQAKFDANTETGPAQPTRSAPSGLAGRSRLGMRPAEGACGRDCPAIASVAAREQFRVRHKPVQGTRSARTT